MSGFYKLDHKCDLTQPDHFLVQGIIACSISARIKKDLAKLTVLTHSVTYQKLDG